jgi:hypothetical protein
VSKEKEMILPTWEDRERERGKIPLHESFSFSVRVEGHPDNGGTFTIEPVVEDGQKTGKVK